MDITFKLLPTTMPDFIFYEIPAVLKQNGLKLDNKIPVSELNEKQVLEYAEMIRAEFVRHWTQEKANKTLASAG